MIECFAVGGDLDGEAFAQQHIAHEAMDLLVVLNDHDKRICNLRHECHATEARTKIKGTRLGCYTSLRTAN